MSDAPSQPPSPSPTPPPASRARRQMLGMFAIAFVTIGLSYALFYLARSGSSWGTTNHGEFVAPPTTSDSLALTDLTGAPFATDGTWWIWLSTADCAAQCETQLQQMRSLHVLLNRDVNRLQRALVLDRINPAAQELGEEFTQLEFLQSNARPASGIYIVDPIGNLVLRYPLDSNPKPVLEDLKRLLKLSQIG